MYWDISLHIDNGRDAGPLANPAHYLILLGLYGVLLSGVLSAALAGERPSRTAISVGAGWWAPVGGAVIAVCGAFALSGLPARRHVAPPVRPGRDALGADPPDADRRRLAGDAGRDGPAVRGDRRRSAATPSATTRARSCCCGAACSPAASSSRCRPSRASSTSACPSSGEVLHPVLIMLAAGIGLVTARVYLGRGGALLAVLGFVLIRGLIARDGRRGLGPDDAALPALHRRGAARRGGLRPRAAARSPVATGALAGGADRDDRAGRGVGVEPRLDAAARGPTRCCPRPPSPASSRRWPPGRSAGSWAARWRGRCGRPAGAGPARAALAGRRSRACSRWWRWSPGACRSGRRPHQRDGEARRRAVGRRARRAGDDPLQPRGCRRRRPFRNVTAWQGGGSVVSELTQIRPGQLPHHEADPGPRRLEGDAAGAHRRLARGGADYLPRDRAIPAPEVPAQASFTRPFVRDVEDPAARAEGRRAGSPEALAYLIVAAIAAGLLALIAWALVRLNEAGTFR